MRKYTLFATRFGGTLLAITFVPLSAPVMAQDESPPPPEESKPPAVETQIQAPQLTPEQQVVFDAWSAEQQVSFAAWPADVQTYYWTLARPRQDAFWQLTDNDKVAITRMEPVDQAEAWTLVERRLQQREADEPNEMPEKPAGS